MYRILPIRLLYSHAVRNVYETVDITSYQKEESKRGTVDEGMKLKFDSQKQVHKEDGNYDCTPPPIPARGYSISPTQDCNQLPKQQNSGERGQSKILPNLDMDAEKIYQPLIPPRRYDDAYIENSDYQSLSFDRADKDSQVHTPAQRSESQTKGAVS